MNTWLKRAVGAVVAGVVVQAGVAGAGESPWSLRLGVSYRDFDEIEFQSANFRNFGMQGIPGGPFGIQNVTTVVGLVTPIILDYVRYNGGSEGLDDGSKFAPVIGVRYDLMQVGKVRLALAGNFQYYRMDAETVGAAGDFTHLQFQHNIDLLGQVQPNLGAPIVPPLRPGTTFALSNQFEMDLFVLDLGVEARMLVDCFNFTFALGPSLTIVNAESNQTQQAAWTAQVPPGAPPGVGLAGGSYVLDESDSQIDFLPGAYVAFGVTYDLSVSWTIGLEYRYDYVSGDAGTSHAQLDPSGSSGILSVAYRF